LSARRWAHRAGAGGALVGGLVLAALPPGADTDPAPYGDGTGAPARHGTTGPRHCAECGAVLRVHTTGRPPRYCGPTCRQRAHRRRLAGRG
ncbi:TetR/AcrR family transcriptional regulator, partial [Nonomuraea wenchangensis]